MPKILRLEDRSGRVEKEQNVNVSFHSLISQAGGITFGKLSQLPLAKACLELGETGSNLKVSIFSRILLLSIVTFV